ncbi:uncharacterized protein LOC109852828 isoform X2 [Pseudomyrmex gracilis]|uniref:uncharacterized protein LOC109852828 isoform X2 n=1 Tax=Pseudomyrmex gracilis TaxID=219809 RepID=UPI000994C1DC|nr:uncharacterized protein LOC109852828 isoform X2 [Pseudomyrmex gracilis]
MRSSYMRIKLYKLNPTVQRINFVRMNSSLLLKALTVKFFVTSFILCVLFQIVASQQVEKNINLEVGREKREAVDVQINTKLLESKNDNKTVQIYQKKNTNNSEYEKRNDETFYLEDERVRIRRKNRKNKRSHKGTKNQKKHRRNKRWRTNGVMVAKFNGAIPEMHIKDDGLIGPWMKSVYEVNNPFEFTNFHLVEEQKTIEINKSGLYTISVQIGYTVPIVRTVHVLLVQPSI